MSLSLEGYTLTEVLHEGESTIVYRGFRDADHTGVVVKTTRSDYPAALDLAKLRHEQAVLSDIQGPGVVPVNAPAISGRRFVLIMKDVGLQSLDRMLSERLDLGFALRVLIAVSSVLQRAHQRRIVHKDIKPLNILVGVDPLQVYVIDWGIASQLRKEVDGEDDLKLPEEGTLDYLAPEQTGLIDRAIDARTDLYSLGATAYQLFTGTLPFAGDHPKALLRSHLTRMPAPLYEVDPRVPRQLSDIVMKLLAKGAEDRYASARGLAIDLGECLSQWERTGQITPFPLGRSDTSWELRIPQKLYGREAELAAISTAFQRAKRSSAELLLVTGQGGAGKSAVVQEACAAMKLAGAHVTSGKHQQLRGVVPYAGLAQAFSELIRRVMAEPPAVLATWKERLRVRLGQSANVLVPIIPELERLLGPHAPVAELGVSGAEGRVALALQQFVALFASPEQPLVLFIDDLQWSEPASLKVLDLLLTNPESRHLLIIGAYRDHDLDAIQSLMSAVDGIVKAGVPTLRLDLRPLLPTDVNRLIADTMETTVTAVTELGEEIYRRSQGNPFFVSQLLTSLSQDGLLALDGELGAWRWDLAAIRQQAATDDVAEFVAQRLRRLAPATRELLKLAAAVGTQFDHEILTRLAGKTTAACADGLSSALGAGILVPLHGDYRLLNQVDDDVSGRVDPDAAIAAGDATALAARVTYRFVHDRVQEASYLLIDEGDRASIHLRVARLLQARFAGGVPNEAVFTVANHLNLAQTLVADRGERLAAVTLNFRAGHRAMSSVAYAAARSYLGAALAFLPEDAWDTEHALSAAVRCEHAEAVFLAGDHPEADARFDDLLRRTPEPLQQVALHIVRMNLYTSIVRLSEVTQIGLAALATLGAPMPETEPACQAAFDAELPVLLSGLRERTIKNLVEAPPVDDARVRTILKVLILLDAGASTGSPKLSALASLRQVLLSMDHGPSEMSATGYVACALTLSRVGQPREAERMLQVANMLHERYPSAEYAARVSLMSANAANTLRPLRDAIAAYQRTMDVGLQYGDMVALGWSAPTLIMMCLAADEELTALQTRLDSVYRIVRQAKQGMSMAFIDLVRQVIACLAGKTRGPCSLTDGSFDEDAFVTSAPKVLVALHWSYKLMLLCLHGEHEAAVPLLEQSAGMMPYMNQTFQGQAAFYSCLHLYALLEGASGEGAERYEKMLDEQRAMLARMKVVCEEKWRAFDLLLSAEQARLAGQTEQAQSLYDQSIDSAQQGGFMRLVSLGNELCGKLNLKRGHEKVARLYLSDAYSSWLRWGAHAKAHAMTSRFPGLVTMSVQWQPPNTSATTRRGSSTVALQGVLFDLTEAMRAAYDISSEIVAPRIIEHFLRAACTSAAARRAFVILFRGEEMTIAGEATVNRQDIDVALRSGSPTDSELPLSVLRYVARTEEAVVLYERSPTTLFTDDPYIREHRPGFVLCLPLVHQGRLSGALYAEGELSGGGPRPGLVDLMQLLASQAASALDNAELYTQLQAASEQLSRANDHLEAEVVKRTAELRTANIRLVQLEREATEVQMAGGFAHEMRNALAAANMFITAGFNPDGESLCRENSGTLKNLFLLLQKELPPQERISAATLLEKVVNNEERLDTILGRTGSAITRALRVTHLILEYARISSAQPSHGPVALRSLVTSILAECAADLDAHRIVTEVGIAPEWEPRGNEAHFASILKHLVQNARDAIVEKHGAGPRELRIDAMEEPEHWVLRVSDTGVGIAPENQGSVFTPFFSTRPAIGTGLGLGMVEKLARLYDGSIRFESEVGRGTTFTLTFPR